MAVFSYRGRNEAGQLIEARLDAASAESVASQLLEAGITPIRIVEAKSPASGDLDLSALWSRKRVKTEDLIVFCRHMNRLSRAGIPIIRAITGLVESTHHLAFAEVLRDVAESLRSGRQLSEALQRHPAIFSNLFVSVIQVGENTGQLEEAFDQMALYLELDRETRKRIKAATRYPILVIGAISAALFLINLFVIPAFVRTFESFGAELPWATRLLMATSGFAVSYWPHVLAATAAVVVAMRTYLNTEEGRFRWDRLRMHLPLVGSIVERATLARYARSFAMTFNAGVPVIEVLRVAARAVDNGYVAERIHAMRDRIEHGETLTRAAYACGLFNPLMLQMMAVGEESGAVGDMHQEIAESYESEVDYDLKRLSDMIEPLLIVGVGGIVLLLALGVYLPMWDLAAAARGGG